MNTLFNFNDFVNEKVNNETVVENVEPVETTTENSTEEILENNNENIDLTKDVTTEEFIQTL